jgi:hypothetical protein
MAADQKNFQHFLYVDDNGVSWTKRGELDAARNAVDGSAAATGAPTWNDSASMKTRKVIYLDPTTGRTKTIIVYTAAAFAAITLASTLAFHVEGNTATVTYTADKKVGEKQPRRGVITGHADHA